MEGVNWLNFELKLVFFFLSELQLTSFTSMQVSSYNLVNIYLILVEVASCQRFQNEECKLSQVVNSEFLV